MASISLRNGRFRVHFRAPGGRQFSRTFDRRVDAEAFRVHVELAKANGWPLDYSSSGATVAEHYDRNGWKVFESLRPSTRMRYLSAWRTHVQPRFGHRMVSHLTHGEIQDWVYNLETMLAPASVHKVVQVLRLILDDAIRRNVISGDPAAFLRLPRVTRSEDAYLTPAQVRELADSMTRVNPRYRALVWLGCYAGPRIGELAALRWDDLDFQEGTLRIRRSVQEISGLGLVVDEVKTAAGIRSIPLPPSVVGELHLHRRSFGVGEWMFTSPTGMALRHGQLRRRQWPVAIAGAVSVPRRMTFKDMRHTAVSLWIAAGASDMQIAKWAGHTSAAFTKDRYGHLFPEHGEGQVAALERMIETNTERPAAASQLE